VTFSEQAGSPHVLKSPLFPDKTTAVYCNVKENKTVCKFIVDGLGPLLTAEESHRLSILGD